MTLYVLTVMIFLVTLGLTISGVYFLVEVPASKKRMHSRLAAIEQASFDAPGEEIGLLRAEILSQIPALNRFLLRIPPLVRLHLFIQQAAMEITAAMLLLACVASGLLVFLIGLLFGVADVLLVAAVAGACAVPVMVVAFKRSRRFSRFEELFPDAIDLLARAVRAGHAFTTALELIAQELPEPVAGEFRKTYEQQNFGMPLREALHNFTVRMPLSDVSFFVSALQVQRESGGNLAEILDNLAFVIRERFKILRQVKVFTAQGRMTLYLLTGLGPAAAVMMLLVNPEYIGRFFKDPQPKVSIFLLGQVPLGSVMIGFALILQFVGYLVIKKIIKIRV
ncbi:MAG TPA: type II secretion system F family protein [Blastocatellia bacterium]|jgi:tight adherence protein B|nr:type II secretion system F family protein [Blastocatellia bacterium]